MNNKLTILLKELGLSDNEASVYLAALGLGNTTVAKIASVSGVKRTTVYSIIESLKLKGLITVKIKGFKQYFVAESPERLEEMIEYKRQSFKDLLPEFMKVYTADDNSNFIRYYEGVNGMKMVYNNILRELSPGDYYLAISDTDKFQKIDQSYFDIFLKKRTKLNINTRLLLQNSTKAKERQKFERNFNEKIKILPQNTTLTTNLVIIPSKVIIHQLVPPIIVTVIENKNIVKMHKEMFEIMWNSIPS